MAESVFEFSRVDLQRIDYIADAIDADDITQLQPDDLVLWGEYQAAIARTNAKQADSVEAERAKIAKVAADNREAAANALNRLADLASAAYDRSVNA